MALKTKIIFLEYLHDYDALAIGQADPTLYSVLCFNPDIELRRCFTLKIIPKPLRTRLKKNAIKRMFVKHSDAIFIVMDTRITLEAIYEYRGHVDAHILMRNILLPEIKTGKRVLALKKKKYPIWSFDREDCSKYAFNYYNQFVSRIPGLKEGITQYDLTFVGKDKGRAVVLEKLSNKFSNAGLTNYFNIRSCDKHSVNKKLSYTEYIRILCSGLCIVDVVQKNQTGMTLRPLEALIYGRKLLTNCTSVKKEPFYHPNNIYIVSDFDLLDVDNFKLFLGKPSVDMSEELLCRYSINDFLDRVTEQRTEGEFTGE